jgi:D-glycero-D-manno-heptose 1,7-bisphosphate phosphatase
VDYSSRAVLIDRDGVILRPVWKKGLKLPTSPVSLEEFEIFPRVTEALALLKEIGFLRVLVTNQPDVRKRLVSPEVWAEMQNRVMNLGFDCAYICPHLTEDNCGCKKPRPGMLLAAAKKWNLDLPSCYMIGDTAADTGAAKAAGSKSILIMAPYNRGIESDYVAEDLLDAVYLIQQFERGRV